MLIEVFKTVLILSSVGSVLALLMLVIGPIAERLFGAKWQFYAWLLILVVMICPVRIENKVSLPKPIEQSIRAVSVKEIPTVSVVEDFDGVYVTGVQTAEKQKPFECVGTISAVWLAVMTLLLGKTVACNLLLKHKLRKNSVYCKKFGNACVRESADVGAPLLVGWLRPVLYVPLGMSKSSRMEYVMAHEGIHLKRNDICLKWIATLVKCVHWFNPLVYVATRRLDEACEISCDAEVAKDMNEDEKTQYMQMLLDISLNEMNFRKTPTAGLSADGRCLKKRFDTIKSQNGKGRLTHIVGSFVFVAVTVSSVLMGGVIQGSSVEDLPAQLVMIAQKKAEWKSEPLVSDSSEASDADTAKTVEESFRDEPVVESIPEEEVFQESVEETIEIEAPIVWQSHGQFNSTDGDTMSIFGIQADDAGCINVEMHSNAHETVDIFISDAESGRDVYSFSMPVPRDAAYCIEGLESGKLYNIVLKGAMRNDWNIESEYMIY